MTRTEELLAAVESAINSNTIISFANPTAIKQLCLRQQKLEALVRLQHEALKLHSEQYPHMQKGYTVDAIDAFERFEQGEK